MRHDSPSGRFVTRCSGGRAGRSTARPKEPVLSTRPRHLAPGTASGGPRPRPARHGLRGPGSARAFLLISFACGFLLVAAPLALLFTGSGVPGSGLFGGSSGADGSGGSDGSSGSGGAATLAPAPGRGGIATESSSSQAPGGGLVPVDGTTVVGGDVPAGGLVLDGSGGGGGLVAGAVGGSAGGGHGGTGAGGPAGRP